MRLCAIASGSSGNCIYVGSEETHLLVDAGISGKRVQEGLSDLGLLPADIDAICVTHEHIDHISGLGVLARKYGIPIYGTPGTLREAQASGRLGNVDESLFHEVNPDEIFSIGDLSICPVRTSHDAAEPVAYRFRQGSHSAGVLTDLGCYSDYTVECFQGLELLYLEANHDVRMLQAGSYPYWLKQRILGEGGHLSNEDSGRLLSRLLNDHMQAVMLGHLSKENNLPELAYESVRVEITMSDTGYQSGDFPLYVAKRSELSQLMEI